jgi:RNA polymerase sigma-70 factor (ECF subfamily)
MYISPMETYRPRLRKTALRLVHNESDADDIVQEAFVRWFTAPPPDMRCPEAWLTTVVRRLCVDAHRARKKEHLCDPGTLVAIASREHVEFDRPLEVEHDIAVLLQRLSERASADECLALLLREGFGYSYSDIARVMKKTQDACRQLVHRGKCAAQGVRAPRRSASVPRTTAKAFVDALRRCNVQTAAEILCSSVLSARSATGTELHA